MKGSMDRTALRKPSGIKPFAGAVWSNPELIDDFIVTKIIELRFRENLMTLHSAGHAPSAAPQFRGKADPSRRLYRDGK
jgi:hypothetical protein